MSHATQSMCKGKTNANGSNIRMCIFEIEKSMLL